MGEPGHLLRTARKVLSPLEWGFRGPFEQKCEFHDGH